MSCEVLLDFWDDTFRSIERGTISTQFFVGCEDASGADSRVAATPMGWRKHVELRYEHGHFEPWPWHLRQARRSENAVEDQFGEGDGVCEAEVGEDFRVDFAEDADRVVIDHHDGRAPFNEC